MNRSVVRALVASVFSGAMLAALPSASLAADVPEAFAPDHAMSAALEKGDAKAVGRLLDERFQWVDVNGAVHTKAEALAHLAAFAASDHGNHMPTELVTRDYGQVEVLRGIHNNQKFAHVWVKDPAAGAPWRAFVYLDTAYRPGPAREFKPSAPRNADKCENPCTSIPMVHPANAKQQAALSAWQRIKGDEWHANAADWDAMTDVDHITISEGSALPKRPHVEQLEQQHAAFGGAGAGTPIISMQLADFGNVVIMTDYEGRDSAKPNGFAMRLFIDRGEGWKICLSVHTSVKASETASAG